MNIEKRGIALAIVLSIITCGIYGIYWLYKLNDEVSTLAGVEGYTSGGKVIVFTIITCGIYGIYWNYKMGERVDMIKGEKGSTGILYLVLSLFGLSIVNYALMQDAVNNKVA